jgi:hypothetical protein
MRRFIKNDRLAWSILLLSYPQYTTRCGRAQAGGVR